MVAFWGACCIIILVSKDQRSTFPATIFNPRHKSTLLVRGSPGRDMMFSRRAPESRLFCGGTDGLNQFPTNTPKPILCRVSGITAGFFGCARRSLRLWSVRPPRTEARPGRFNRAAGAGSSRCGPDLGPAAFRPPTT